MCVTLGSFDNIGTCCRQRLSHKTKTTVVQDIKRVARDIQMTLLFAFLQRELTSMLLVLCRTSPRKTPASGRKNAKKCVRVMILLGLW